MATQDYANGSEFTASKIGRRGRRGMTRSGDPKGLPDGGARLELAQTYLDIQRRLWPRAVELGTLPAPTPGDARKLADEFLARFRGEPAGADGQPTGGLGKRLGAAYLRYSCDNSNPRSLDQQLKNALERAARDGTFVPWELVFADAAVTGTTADRRGYALAKAAMTRPAGGPECLYVDEIGRASRDAVEALRLGKLVEAARKRMVGASDNFDSDAPTSKLQLHLFAMLNEWFVDQLRTKVVRGMGGGFARGKNLGKAAVGYRLVPLLDAGGRQVVGDTGKPQSRKQIDEVQAGHVREGLPAVRRGGVEPGTGSETV